ncbi:hypothetical protein [Mycolicibacterium canariasense]|uniref:hypothetical protein n=1 Tax=Mycolicibacterium canariasense TaxID=228230 RepID=UPI0032D56BCF
MAFTVKYQKSSGITVTDEFGDQGIYDFIEGGVLKIVSPDTDGKVSYTPPTVWLSVSADKEHRPGRPKREGEGRGRGRAVVV